LTGTDRNRPWKLENESTMLKVNAEVLMHIILSNLITQRNGPENILP
jgi:hypothetical protein